MPPHGLDQALQVLALARRLGQQIVQVIALVEGDAEGTAELLRTAFGVGPEGAVFGVSVAPEVAIRFRIVATRAE